MTEVLDKRVHAGIAVAVSLVLLAIGGAWTAQANASSPQGVAAGGNPRGSISALGGGKGLAGCTIRRDCNRRESRLRTRSGRKRVANRRSCQGGRRFTLRKVPSSGSSSFLGRSFTLGLKSFTTRSCRISLRKSRRSYRRYRRRFSRTNRRAGVSISYCDALPLFCKPPRRAGGKARVCKGLNGKRLNPRRDRDKDRIVDGLEIDLFTLRGVQLSLCSRDSDGDKVSDRRDLAPAGPGGGVQRPRPSGQARAADAGVGLPPIIGDPFPDTPGIKVTPIVDELKHEDACCTQSTLDDLEPANDDPVFTHDSYLGTGNWQSAEGPGGFVAFDRLTHAKHEDGLRDRATTDFRGQTITLPQDINQWRPREDGLQPGRFSETADGVFEGNKFARTSKRGGIPNLNDLFVDGDPKLLKAPAISLVVLPLDHDNGCNNDVFNYGEPTADGYCGRPEDRLLLGKYQTLDVVWLLARGPGDITGTINEAGEVAGPNGFCPWVYAIQACFKLEVRLQTGCCDPPPPPPCGDLAIGIAHWLDPTVERITNMPADLIDCPVVVPGD